MASFQYIAITSAGERVAGVLAAGNEQAILAELESRRLVPVSIKPVEEKRASRVLRRIPVRALATTYVQLADLLRAGVPLMRGLRLLGSRRSNPTLAKVFAELADAVAGGSELAEAMSARPDAFSRVHVAMVRAGERGGFLEQVFARMGTFMLAQADLRSKVIGSMIYPAILMFFGTGILGLIFSVFIPMFRPIFAKLDLPWITRLVLGVSEIVSHYGLFVAVGVIVGVIALWRISAQPAVHRRIDRIKLRTPVLGPLLRSLAAARFCRILGTLLGNSIPMIAAMQIAKDAAGNTVLEDAIGAASDAVKQGQPLAPPLQASGLFQDDVIEMIAVGESANNLDEVLVTISDTLEQRLDRQLGVAIKFIEPAMLVILAAIVGVVAIALILPMTQLAGGIE